MLKFFNTKLIKGQKGFGDSIYLYPIVKWHEDKKYHITIYSDHKEIFKPLKCNVLPYGSGDTINAGYLHKKHLSTNQFEDICTELNIPIIPLEMDISDKSPLEINTNKKICVINHAYLPLEGMKNPIVEAKNMVPNHEITQRIINDFKKDFFYILVGRTKTIKMKYSNIDLNLSSENYPNITKLLNICYNSDMIISQTGHMLAIGETLNKPTFIIFAEKGLKSTDPFINTIKPEKVITNNKTCYCVDSEPYELIFDKFKKYVLANSKSSISSTSTASGADTSTIQGLNPTLLL